MIAGQMSLGMLLVAWSAAGWGQSTVKDVTDRGVKPLAASELRTLLPGSIYKGTDSGSTWEYTLEKNGQVIGTLTGHFVNPVHGNWTVDDSGRACFDVSTFRSKNQMNNKKCHFIFQVGDTYYASRKTEPDAPLYKVTLAR